MEKRITYSIPEAAAALGVGRSTLYELMTAGELRSYQVGRRRFVKPEEVQRFINRRCTEAA